MKAVIDNRGRFICYHRDGTYDLRMPKGVGFERIRIVNGKVVDLANLDQIWVENQNGIWFLHAQEYPNTQLVNMKYSDRKNLISEKGVYRIKTAQEVTNENIQRQQRNFERRELRKDLETFIENLKFNEIDQIVGNVWGQLNQSQQAYLKTMSKVVLYLAKKELRR